MHITSTTKSTELTSYIEPWDQLAARLNKILLPSILLLIQYPYPPIFLEPTLARRPARQILGAKDLKFRSRVYGEVLRSLTFLWCP